MELRRFDDPATFYARAERFLVAKEAEHNLMLGLCAGLIERPERVGQPPYLATVEAGGAVVAAALRTPPHNLVLSAAAPAALALIADDLARQERALPGVLGPQPAVRAFAEHWQARSGQPFRLAVAQRIYQLERVVPVVGVPGAPRRATQDDWELLVTWIMEFTLEAHGLADRDRAERTVDGRLAGPSSALYLWEDGRPVSLAGYSGPTPSGIRVGPVYTPPAGRRRGYASAVTAALSQLLLDRGYRYCFLFTDLSNPTSNHIYQAIGYRPVCDVDEYRFDPIHEGR